MSTRVNYNLSSDVWKMQAVASTNRGLPGLINCNAEADSKILFSIYFSQE